MVSMRRALLLLAGASLVVGCTVVRETQPSRTATEQLLISRAADRAIERLALGLPAGSAVFLEAANFEGFDGKYAVSALKAHLLEGGARLAADKDEAEIIVEARAGALSIDKSERLFGIPSYDIPIPLAGTVPTPEIALFKDETQRGIAKFALFATRAEDGALLAAAGPAYGYARRTEWVALQFLSWTTDDLIPDGERP